MGTATKTTKKTGAREKLPAKQKRCVDCNKIKHKFKDFKPRWGRCSKHKEQGKPFQERCKGCQEMRMHNIRQPRCVECDANRTKKEPAAPAKKVGRKKKVVTPVQVPAPTTEAAPAPAQSPPAPVKAPEPEPAMAATSGDALATVAGLLDDPAEDHPPF